MDIFTAYIKSLYGISVDSVFDLLPYVEANRLKELDTLALSDKASSVAVTESDEIIPCDEAVIADVFKTTLHGLLMSVGVADSCTSFEDGSLCVSVGGDTLFEGSLSVTEIDAITPVFVDGGDKGLAASSFSSLSSLDLFADDSYSDSVYSRLVSDDDDNDDVADTEFIAEAELTSVALADGTVADTSFASVVSEVAEDIVDSSLSSDSTELDALVSVISSQDAVTGAMIDVVGKLGFSVCRLAKQAASSIKTTVKNSLTSD